MSGSKQQSVCMVQSSSTPPIYKVRKKWGRSWRRRIGRVEEKGSECGIIGREGQGVWKRRAGKVEEKGREGGREGWGWCKRIGRGWKRRTGTDLLH